MMSDCYYPTDNTPPDSSSNIPLDIRHVESQSSLQGLCMTESKIERDNFFSVSDCFGAHCLSRDVDNSLAGTYRVRVEAGWKAPIGYFNDDVELFVLEGEIQHSGFHLRRHSYAHIPKQVVVGPWVASTDTTLLWMPSSPVFYRARAFADLEQKPSSALFSKDTQQHHRAGLYIPVMDLDAMSWESTTFLPPGAVRKSLFNDPATGRTTWVLGLVPGWRGSSSAESHPSTEEAYMLRGGIEGYWSMDHAPHERTYGVMEKDGYFFRPAFLQHGPFVSEHGALVLFRTTGQLKVNWTLHD